MEKKGRHGAIVADLSHELPETPYGGVCPLAFAASIAVVDETRFPLGLQIADKEMVDNPIPEVGGEDLTGLGAFCDKAGGRKGAVGAGIQFISQSDEVFLGMKLKLQGGSAAALASPAVQLRLIDVPQ